MTHSLLTPCRLGALELKNRVVMAPLTRCRADNPEAAPTPLMATYYAQRAGAGLIVSEGTIVSPRGRGYLNSPGIWSAAQVGGWHRVTDAVHAAGGRIVCQLWHCGRISHPQLTGGEIPVAPSAINPEWRVHTPDGPMQTVTPHALSRSEIRHIVEQFGVAAENAMQAGFDGVELHSSNGYLFHQFFSRCSNQRDDEYGGSHENRARFFFEVLNEVARHVPMERIGFRLNPMLNRFHGITVDADTVPMWSYLVQEASRFPLAYLHLTEVVHPRQLLDNPHGLSDVAAHFRPLAAMPLIDNGALYPFKAAKRIEEGLCDAVAFGQAWIANPDLVERIANGWPLAPADPATFYGGGASGYINYPRSIEMGETAGTSALA